MKSIEYGIFLIILFFLAGCASAQFNSDVNKNVNRKEAIIIAQDCLKSSEYKEQYSMADYSVVYDKGEAPFSNLWKFGRSAWMIQFKSKEKNDSCMYGAVIFEDGKEQHCQCMYGM